MSIRTAIRFSAVAAISAQAFFGLAAETNAERLWRPDDQMRFLWATVDPILPDLVRQGFNAVITCTGPAYDLEKDAPVADLEAFCSKRKKRLDYIQSLGLTLFEQPPYAHNPAMDERFRRVNRDGSPAKRKKNPDAANPEYQAIIRRAFEAEARTIAGHPVVFGLQTSSEVHDFSQISLTAKTAADWKAFSGMDIPEYADKGPWPRVPPDWKLLVAKGQMDPSRVIPDDYPLLRFFRWVWKTGDGWNDYQRLAGEAYNGAAARRVATQFDPLLRTPASRTSFPDVDYLNHWEYPVPDPYSVCYIVSEEQSRVRGTRHSIMTMIQAIVYRSNVAPKDEHPANEPAWTKEFPATSHPTTPADILQEAIWSAFARKTDAIGFHGWCALYDGMIINLRHDLDRYQCADPTAIKTIGRLFREVGEPLGPLFKALPERQMEVAVLESDAAQFFNGTLWSSSLRGTKTDVGNLAVMANLNPQTLLEDEIAANGIPASVKVLIMPSCDVMTESGVRAVKAFQSRGGRVLADARLVPSIRPDGIVKTVEAAWKEKDFDCDDGVADPAKDATLRMRLVQKSAARLKKASGLVPFADTDTPSIFTWTRTCGSADYVFAINDRRTFGDYVGAWKRLCEKGEPNAGTVIVSRPAGAVYDLVRHVPVPFSVKDGKTRIKVEYTTNDGRLFMVAAAPLKSLDVSRDGGRLVVTSPDRDVMIPIQVKVGEGRAFYGVVANGRYETSVDASMPVRIVNLATGQVSGQAGRFAEREYIWPEGRMPDVQEHQVAAMTNEKEKGKFPYLDWCPAPEKPNGCCIILVSGGGYSSCCDVRLVQMWERKFTAAGFQCVNFVYRTPRPKGLPIHQSAWEDGQRAVRMVRSEAAKRGFDPEKIGTMSMSAGSHLAALLATSALTPAYAKVDELDDIPCHVNWAITGAIAYAMTDGIGMPNTRNGQAVDVKLDDIFKFDEKTAPMCMFHGSADVYSPTASTFVYRELRKRKVPAELHLFADRPHPFWGVDGNGDRATGYDNWFDRAHEFLAQMGFLGQLPPEEDLMERFARDFHDPALYAKEDLWPKGRIPDLQKKQNVPYLEWYIPSNLTTKAIQIIYSGGSYQSNNPDGFEVVPARRFLNEKGMAVVTMKYRVPRPEKPLAKHTTAWQDLQRCIRIVRSKAAEKGLDPNRIGIMGSSAGGHLTLMGVTSSRSRSYLGIDDIDKIPCNVQWGVGIYPAYALTDGADVNNTTGGNDDSAWLVPEFAFDPDTCPMVFIHGDADGWAAMNSVKAWEQMRRMGVASDLHTLCKRPHCFQRKASPGTGSYTWLGRVWEFMNHKGFNR